MSRVWQIVSLPMGPETHSLECSECGIVGLISAEDAKAECYKHWATHQENRQENDSE